MQSMRSDSIRRQTRPGSKARSTMLVIPRWMFEVSGVSAPTWKSGNATMNRSACRSSAVVNTLRLPQVAVACVCTTPFGKPVVPDVYMM
jgi:hypothetical protein